MTPAERAESILQEHNLTTSTSYSLRLRESIVAAIEYFVILEREACSSELEKAFTEADTLNLLHGAARIRARGKAVE